MNYAFRAGSWHMIIPLYEKLIKKYQYFPQNPHIEPKDINEANCLKDLKGGIGCGDFLPPFY